MPTHEIRPNANIEIRPNAASPVGFPKHTKFPFLQCSPRTVLAYLADTPSSEGKC